MPCESYEGPCADANGIAYTLHCLSNYLSPKHFVTGCRESRMYKSSAIRRWKSSNKSALPSILGILAGGSGDARKPRTQHHAAPLACATSERADESRCGSPAMEKPRDKVIEKSVKKPGSKSKSKSKPRLDLPRRPRLLPGDGKFSALDGALRLPRGTQPLAGWTSAVPHDTEQDMGTHGM